ncbi:MAG TPA: hypothetical protein VIY68_21240, partial [Steroidobacteraceae bacterium]
ENVIGVAEATVETERKNALDPICCSDPDAAREAVASAEFFVLRLRALLPRLEDRLARVAAAEERAEWKARYQPLKAERDALAAELAEVYPQVAAELAHLFGRIAANDIKLNELHLSRPSGISLHLISAELLARGLGTFNPANPSIATELRLPAWENSAAALWPPAQVPLAVLAVSTVPSYAGPNWFKGDKAKAAAERAEADRVARYYAQEQREREERENRNHLR